MKQFLVVEIADVWYIVFANQDDATYLCDGLNRDWEANV